jgi:hypothetical protein
MPATKHVRRSVSLPTPIAKQVERMAKSQRLSDNRILVELIELGIEARPSSSLPNAFVPQAIRSRPSAWATNWAVWFSVNNAPDRNLAAHPVSHSRPSGRAHARPQHQPKTTSTVFGFGWKQDRLSPKDPGSKISARSNSAARANTPRHFFWLARLRQAKGSNSQTNSITTRRPTKAAARCKLDSVMSRPTRSFSSA